MAAVARRPLSVRHRDRVALSRLAMLQAGRGTFVATFNRENALLKWLEGTFKERSVVLAFAHPHVCA